MDFRNTLLAEYEELERDYAYYLKKYGHDEEMQYHLESIRRTCERLKQQNVCSNEHAERNRQTVS